MKTNAKAGRQDTCYAKIDKTTYSYTASSTQLTPQISSRACNPEDHCTREVERESWPGDNATEHANDKSMATKRIWLVKYIVFCADVQCFLVCMQACVKLPWTLLARDAARFCACFPWEGAMVDRAATSREPLHSTLCYGRGWEEDQEDEDYAVTGTMTAISAVSVKAEDGHS